MIKLFLSSICTISLFSTLQTEEQGSVPFQDSNYPIDINESVNIDEANGSGYYLSQGKETNLETVDTNFSYQTELFEQIENYSTGTNESVNIGEANGSGYYPSQGEETNLETIDTNPSYQTELFEQIKKIVKKVTLSTDGNRILSLTLDGTIDFKPYLSENENIATFYINLGNPYYFDNRIIKDYSDEPKGEVTLNNETMTTELPLSNSGKYNINFDFYTSIKNNNNIGNHIKFNVITFNLSDLALSKIETKPLTIVKGPNSTWDVNDSVTRVTDANGNVIDTSNIFYSGSLDLNRVDTYSMNYSYTDVFGNIITNSSEIYVIEPKTELNTSNSTLVAGPDTTWFPEDNFNGAKDENGNDIPISEVIVNGSVNPQVPGEYPIKYTYTDKVGNTVTKIVIVTVKNPTAIGLLTIKYIDENGVEISPTETLTGKIGESYITSGKDIAGFTLVTTKLPNNAFGIFTEEPIEVVYTYIKSNQIKKDTDNSTDSTTEITNKKSNKNNSNSGNKIPMNTDSKTTGLPQTGEINSPLLTLLGIIMMVASSAHILNIKRKKNN